MHACVHGCAQRLASDFLGTRSGVTAARRKVSVSVPPIPYQCVTLTLALCTQFVYVIRKRISIPPDKAIFIFVSNTLPPTAALMSTVYEQHRDEVCARSTGAGNDSAYLHVERAAPRLLTHCAVLW